jgi:ubiquinone/menaquinone biosynthesis C-methylase UbiE
MVVDGKDRAKRVWSQTPAGSLFARDLVPGTKEFFEVTRKMRSEYELPWLEEVFDFGSTSKKKVLEIGFGSGYDALEFCQSGADYVGIDITPENRERAAKHLSYFGFTPRLLQGDAEALAFDNNSFDVVYSNGVLHHTPDILKSFREAFRVLRKNGEFCVIVYNRNSVFYWFSLLLVDYLLTFGFLRESLRHRLSRIEYTTSKELPIVNVYTRSTLTALLREAGFTVNSVVVRKLTREDFPNILPLQALLRRIPQSSFDRLGQKMGWYLVAKASVESKAESA